MYAKFINARRLSRAGYAADAYAHALATIRQTAVNDLLSTGIVVGMYALYECHLLLQNGDITLDDTLHHLAYGQLTTTEAVAL